MQAELACAPVGEEVSQRVAHGVKGDLVPGNLGLCEKPGLHGLVAGIEAESHRQGMQLLLSDTRDDEEREERVVANLLAHHVGGMLIAVACLGVSRYVLQLDSPLADNIAANVTPTATSSAKGNKRIGCHSFASASTACSTVGADGTARG